MTERVLPAVAFPVNGRSAGARSTRSVAIPAEARRESPARATTRRMESLLNTPARAGMLLGASAAVYAVTLAGVAAFQSQGDAAVAAQSRPYLDAVAQRKAANDRLEVTLGSLNDQLTSLGASYAATGQSVTAYETRLDALAALVTQVQGSVAAAPTHISLPTVSTTRTAPAAAAPRVTTTTSASGKAKP